MLLSDVWPIDELHRYRVYAVKDDEMNVIAAAPDPDGVGLALATIHADEREAGRPGLSDLGMIGFLDVLASDWVLLPFPRGPH